MRQRRHVACAAMCVFAVLIGGCGRDDGGQTQPAPTQAQTPGQPPATTEETGNMPSPEELAALMEEAHKAFAEMNQGEIVPAVPPDTLKGLLPETLAEMGRTEASAQRSQAMGIDMTNAEAEYESPEGAWMILTITDIGSIGGPLRMAMTAWAQMEYSEEIGSSYERTGIFHGFRGVEEYDKDNEEGAIRVLVADRFVVEIEGSPITMEILKKALSQLDLKRMAALASSS